MHRPFIQSPPRAAATTVESDTRRAQLPEIGSIEPSAFTFETSTLKQIKAVKDRIAELTAEAAERAGVSIERVLNELP